MDFQDKKYIIGIDLGTTNSAVSYVDLEDFSENCEKYQLKDKKCGCDRAGRKKFIKVFNIPQLTGSGEFSRLSVLPSFLYIPGEYDISGKALQHPWKKQNDTFVGTFARDHGSKIPSRLVSSAKSWLCHSGADRQARILPWGSEGVDKVSPVTATSEYLDHIRKAWNYFVKDEDAFLENQFVIITVPASFDETARELTLLAAKQAGFGTDITLLEEPLAAFYSWLVMHENNWQEHVKPDDLILVCDVGGGTSDFTLITLKKVDGSPRFERLAVGDHLILGGDNIDLAIANHIESKFKKKQNLTPDKWKTLCHKCRQAKEKIFGAGEKSVRITLKGRGRALIAGTLAADLERNDLESIVCDGFFPDVNPNEVLNRKTGKAIAEFGLPYEQEPAITKHIIGFLEQHRDDVASILGKEPVPDLILFNGGSLKPKVVRERIRIAIKKRFGLEEKADMPVTLENPDHFLSVAFGAAYYGLVKQGTGVKVGSGSPRSYYLGIAWDKAGGRGIKEKSVCIVERGLDEGSKINFPDMEFEVLTNQPVSFDIFSSSFRSGDKTGDIVEIDESLTPMAPVRTMIRFGKKGGKKTVPIRIEPEYTEMGTLALWCRSCVTNHKWKLQFQLRDNIPDAAKNVAETIVFDDSVIEDVCFLMEKAFVADSESRLLSGLVKNIEKKTERKKTAWPLSLLRTMTDKLITISDKRKLSPQHEARWLNITGFCMRPGFGDAFDEERMRKLWKIYLAGPEFPKAKQNKSEWWIFCRRIAAGLKAGQQRQFFQDISAYILSGKSNGKKNKATPVELTEIWMAAANMERLLVKDKIVLGRTLHVNLKSSKKNPVQLFSALSRIGARELLYGSVDRVVPASEVSVWIKKLIKDHITGKKAAGSGALDAVVAAIAEMARKTGDRTRDIDEEMRQLVLDLFENLSACGNLSENNGKVSLKQEVPSLSESVSRRIRSRSQDMPYSRYIKMVKEKTVIEAKDEQALFGESLPPGIVLKKGL